MYVSTYVVAAIHSWPVVNRLHMKAAALTGERRSNCTKPGMYRWVY